MTLKKPIYLTFLAILATLVMGQAQDIHYSQFQNAPFNLSPGLAGIFPGDIRLMANYKSQWGSIPADFKTGTIAADFKIRNENYQQGFFSTGLVLNWDEVALTRLTNVSALVPISYTQRITDRFFATIGFGASFHQRRFTLNGISFDSQYIDGVYDPNNPNNEPIDGLKTEYIDFSMGFNLRVQSLANNNLASDPYSNRSKLDIGFGIFNLTQPNQSFFENGDDPLPIRLSPYAIGTVMINQKLDLVGRIGSQIQDEYLEAIGGLGIKYHFPDISGKECALLLGINLRFQDFSDAYYPMIGFNYRNLEVGFSYDLNISRLRVATNGNGGPEFSLRYIFERKAQLRPDDCRLL